MLYAGAEVKALTAGERRWRRCLFSMPFSLFI